MYDAIVIGARCAGAPVAMLLARKGYKVLLLDRSRFPSEIAHGHFIHRQGPGGNRVRVRHHFLDTPDKDLERIPGGQRSPF
jgi:flavin-dependent dehydrogenase